MESTTLNAAPAGKGIACHKTQGTYLSDDDMYYRYTHSFSAFGSSCFASRVPRFSILRDLQEAESRTCACVVESAGLGAGRRGTGAGDSCKIIVPFSRRPSREV